MKSFEQIKGHLDSHCYTWLITGVAGFIGSNLAEQLLALNQNVIGLDNFFSGKQKNIAHIQAAYKNNFSFYEIDIVDSKSCEQLFTQHKIDFVLHHAALASVPLSINNPKLACEININGFINILDSAKNNQIKNFVYASSSAVYGDNQDSVKSEKNIGHALSPYATTKLTNELLAQQYSNCFDMPTVGFRYFNIYGKRQDPNGTYAAVIPKWIHQVLKSEPLYINGDGSTTRDFCSIDEVVKANILACFNVNETESKSQSKTLNRVYNIGMGNELSLNNLYSSIIKTANKYNIEYKNLPIYKDYIKGDIKHSCANIELARRELNYNPSTNFNSELDNLFNWIINHE